MRIEAAIFDLDGVLLSTDGLHYEAWKRMADREGIEFDETINERLRGVSRVESLDIILERARRPYSDEEKQALADFKNDLYRASLERLSPGDLFPGVRELLRFLRSLSLGLAIGSSSKNAQAIVERVGLMEFFRGAIVDGTMIAHGKPHPEVFLKAAAIVAADPELCLVFEDAWAGTDAAKAGGMMAVGLGAAGKHPEADFSAPTIGALFSGRYREYARLFALLEAGAPARWAPTAQAPDQA